MGVLVVAAAPIAVAVVVVEVYSYPGSSRRAETTSSGSAHK